MGEIFNNFKDSDQFIVPTDKTNSFRSVITNTYMAIENEFLIS